MNLVEAMNWRYATKRMTGKKVDPSKLANILEAIRLSPSGTGLQPYNIIVVDNDQLKEKIQQVAHNQPAIVEASHLLIFAAWDNVTEARFDEFIKENADQRGGLPEESLTRLNRYKQFMLGRSAEQNAQWAVRQAYIAFGIAIAAAALEQVDATPMEGFLPDALDELLGLKEKGLRSVTILTLGERDQANDWLVNEKKVRRLKEHLFIEMA
jgi:nitroreductase / dihydropteridine reductase